MGCDIHVVFEVRKGKKWVGQTIRQKYEDKNGEVENYDAYFADPLYIERNYRLFAILAGVRNESGTIPIAEPRGCPDDASALAEEEIRKWGVDGHSHSWLTLAEMEAWDGWGDSVTHEGVVDADEYKKFKKVGAPSSWCKSAGGGGIKHISNKEMDQFIASGKPAPPGVSYMTQIRWTVPNTWGLGNFRERVFPELRKLGKPEDVRMVFWFDN